MVRAIDMHVHPVNRPSEAETERQRQMQQYFRGEPTPQDPEGFYRYYKDRDMMGVLLVTGATSEDGEPNHNDWSAELARAHPGTFIGFGGVDPRPCSTRGRRESAQASRGRPGSRTSTPGPTRTSSSSRSAA